MGPFYRIILAGRPQANELSLWRKLNFLKYVHKLHQSAANFMQIKKNIKILCSKPTEKKLQPSLLHDLKPYF